MNSAIQLGTRKNLIHAPNPNQPYPYDYPKSYWTGCSCATTFNCSRKTSNLEKKFRPVIQHLPRDGQTEVSEQGKKHEKS